ncbi:glucoamylase family protein [Bacteroides uniformis]
MKKPIMIHVLALFLISTLAGCASCSSDLKENGKENGKEEKPDTEEVRPESFASDDEMLDYIQKVHLNYMWDGAEPTSGLARERIHLDGDYPEKDQNVVTTGGSGFGIAGLLVGIERGFIPREEGVKRLTKIADYLKRADRFHGVWPHWLYGPTGKVKPFGQKDNGGDLVESCFLMQSLLCVRQYFRDGNEQEKALAEKIDQLWKEMEFSWYQNGKDVIYWHWSPEYNWEMNFPLEGYNEALIVYVLAASSPTYPVPASAYHNGWARGGGDRSDSAPYGLPLELKHNGAEKLGGPLFWAQYSHIGLDPRNLSDRYANYWNVVRNHALSNYRYCVENPKQYKGYGEDCWGLTASYSTKGYAAHCPGDNDHGVITPTAALSSFPYTPEESMRALKYFYSKGDWIWGKYGFYDAFSEGSDWTVPRYLAIDQCTIAPMIENYRSGLLWKLFMSCPEVQEGLQKLGFKA